MGVDECAVGTTNTRLSAGLSILSSPAVDSGSGVVYFGSNDAFLYAVNGTSGALRWKFQTGGYVESSPAVDSSTGSVYIGSDDTYVYAVVAATGACGGSVK